jgi:DNA-binding MarR family transcriptional regulator
MVVAGSSGDAPVAGDRWDATAPAEAAGAPESGGAGGGAADAQLAHLILGVMPRVWHLAVRVAREHGTLTFEQSKALWHLARGPLRAGELAHHSLLTPPAITEVVEGLVRAGLAQRDSDPADRRAVVVAMTPYGRQESERFRAAFAAALGEIVGRLSPAERDRLRVAFTDLHRALLLDDPEPHHSERVGATAAASGETVDHAPIEERGHGC